MPPTIHWAAAAAISIGPARGAEDRFARRTIAPSTTSAVAVAATVDQRSGINALAPSTTAVSEGTHAAGDRLRWTIGRRCYTRPALTRTKKSRFREAHHHETRSSWGWTRR